MAESNVSLTEGSGLDLHSWTRTVSAATVHEQVIAPAEGFFPTYTAIGIAVSAATSADHLLFIQADGTNYTRIRRITVRQVGVPAASTADIRILRTSTAGSGGSTVNARPMDAADTDPYAGTIQTLPSSKGTEGNQVGQIYLGALSAQPVLNTAKEIWEPPGGNVKPLIIGTAATSGLCVKIQTGIASLTVMIEVWFTVSSYL